MRQLKQVQSGKAKSDASITELEEKLSILKKLDIQQVALSALTSKLIKSKLLPKPQQAKTMDEEVSKTFPVWQVAKELGLDTKQTVSTDSALAERVVHQIQSAKVLAEELNSYIHSIAALLPRPSEDSAPVEEKSPDVQQTAARNVEKATVAKQQEQEADDYSSDDGFGEEDTERVSNHAWNVDDMDKLDALVGSASDESDEDVCAIHLSQSDSDDDSENSNDRQPRAKRPRSESPEENEFLPSLASGFIPAADGDDWDDAEADFADQDVSSKGPAKSTRKNRRGQRERRACVSETLTTESGKRSTESMQII